MKRAVFAIVSIVTLFASNGQHSKVTSQLNDLPIHSNGQHASQLFPYTYVPSDHVSDGWTREPGITKVTGSPGPMLLVTKDAAVEVGRMLGFTYRGPTGKKIVRVDFRDVEKIKHPKPT